MHCARAPCVSALLLRDVVFGLTRLLLIQNSNKQLVQPHTTLAASAGKRSAQH